MKLDEKKFFPSEEHSNHAVQAFATGECPKDPKGACCGIATGFGGAMVKLCESFDEENGECRKK